VGPMAEQGEPRDASGEDRAGQAPAGPILCDTGAMVVIHAFFRVQFGEAPDLVRGVREGDLEHAAYVADHLEYLITALHHHHEGEDLMLWDELTRRAPACALHVDRMRRQHAEMSHRLDEMQPTIGPWRDAPGTATAAPLLSALEAVLASLAEHLPDEEQEILPPAATAFTQREWDRMGTVARRQTPRNKMWVQLGSMRAALGEPEGDAWMRDELPAPVVLLWRLAGRRSYARHRARLEAA